MLTPLRMPPSLRKYPRWHLVGLRANNFRSWQVVLHILWVVDYRLPVQFTHCHISSRFFISASGAFTRGHIILTSSLVYARENPEKWQESRPALAFLFC